MRTSPARLLILIAFILVFVVELRTVLAFFDVEITVLESLAIGLLAIGTLLVWALRPAADEPEQ
ncbi:CbaC protein [Natrarchaeobaculum sulfurireducens]|uniref:CbaC protein n=1 Tax=Natrarchaeobaculum sulfurireducens TaxID=2044521 RepID=A0A346PSZ0_9EURY|nr:CbaC protein [Natrarchaeobaculum sulfurireducens]AXR77400.1 hypothetical protein AArc1_1059 [Natrarchaeobaculum sulfurireducens]AXR82635.1 hypothetical protein AArcMg_2645 [Natrarchaeobaculum sulfurireducens]